MILEKVKDMSFSERQEALRKQIWAEAEKTMGKEYIEFARKSSRKAVRDKIIAMNHYYHILLLMGEPALDKAQMYVYHELAIEKIAKLNDKELQHKELIKLNLLSTHTSAWNIAHFHYEKAIKILCMMMVTLMDYIIQEQGARSILYQNLDTSKYFSLLDEITSLNADYREEYFSICSFDFCTKKLGDYLHIPDYDSIAMEHERVINNGNPQRVSAVIQRLREVGGEKRAEVLADIEKAYTPEPLYDEKMFEACYQDLLKQYETEDNAMDDFTGLVSGLTGLYQAKVKP